MQVYGLTGKTGAGKSSVALLMKEKGFFVIDGDIVAREIVLPGQPAHEKLADAFGEDIILSDGSLDRKRLAQKAFSSAENTALLNEITHPFIKKRFEELLLKAEKEGYEKAVIDAAALLESDCRELCERIIVVHADEKTRLERILKRDNITPEQAITRIRGQKDDDYYLSQADYVIVNDGKNGIDYNRLKELFYE